LFVKSIVADFRLIGGVLPPDFNRIWRYDGGITFLTACWQAIIKTYAGDVGKLSRSALKAD